MAFLGLPSSNLSPILFKGNNQPFGLNIFIHSDSSYSMYPVVPLNSTPEASSLFADGTFIEAFQDALLNKKIGDSITDYPNLYAFFDEFTRNVTGSGSGGSFTVTNSNGSLTVNGKRMLLGQTSGLTTRTLWTNYYNAKSIPVIPKDIDNSGIIIDSSGGNRLSGITTDQISEDVHGNIFSIFYTPNQIDTGVPGDYGEIIKSRARFGSRNIIITCSNEQSGSAGNMINFDVRTRDNVPDGTLPAFRFPPNDSVFTTPGFYARRYPGYFYVDSTSRNGGNRENISQWFSTATGFETVQTPNQGSFSQIGLLSSAGLIVDNTKQFPTNSSGNNVWAADYTWMILGYFKPPASGSYDFRLISDGAGFAWIGDSAIRVNSSTGVPIYTASTADLQNAGGTTSTPASKTFNLDGNTYYPIRIVFGNPSGGNNTSNPGVLGFGFKLTSDSTWTSVGTGFYFGGPNIWTTNQSEFFPPLPVDVNRRINGTTGEVARRKYQIISLSSYTSTDGYDGVLFYNPARSTTSYKYVDLQNQTLVESNVPPTSRGWAPSYVVPPTTYNVSGSGLINLSGVTGSGAIIRVDKFDSVYQASVSGVGTGYKLNDEIRILGDPTLGETTPDNDLTVRVTSVGSVSHSFVLDSSYNIPNSSGSGASFSIVKNSGGSGQYSVASIINGGSGYVLNDRIRILGTNLDGVSPTNDLLLRVSAVSSGAVTGVLVESGTPTNYIDYFGLTGDVTGAGSRNPAGATFNIRRGILTYEILQMTSGGLDYAPGDIINIDGALLGGTSSGSNNNDCEIEVLEVDGNGTITALLTPFGYQLVPTSTPDGNLDYTTDIPKSGTVVAGSGNGARFTVVRGSTTTYTVTRGTSGGTSYFVNDRIRIPGTQLGGSSPANDLTITVTAVTGQSINTTGFSFTGTATNSNNPIAGIEIVSGQPTGIIPEPGLLQQTHDMLTLAQESYGALFKIDSVFKNGNQIDQSDRVDRRTQFANILAQFISET